MAELLPTGDDVEVFDYGYNGVCRKYDHRNRSVVGDIILRGRMYWLWYLVGGLYW